MLNELGYKRKTYDEIIEGKIQRAKELFGEDIETDETTALGKFIRINAYDQAMAEEEAEAIYYARFPNTATGVSLDRLCVFVGISRNSAEHSQYEVQVKGTAGATIPFGFLVSTESEIDFYNTSETEIKEDGTCKINVECVIAGTMGNVNADEINIIKNPSADIERILGVKLVKPGTDIESDYVLRKRFNEAKEGLGACNENALRTALLRIETVTSVSVIVNDDDTADSSGRPPHSFECYVAGGENHHFEIASSIYEKKPLGIKTYGTQSYTIIDNGGFSHTINFSHCAYINVDINIKVKVNSDFNELSGKEEISKNIAEYINSLGVGKDVVLSSLYGHIHSVVGVLEVSELSVQKENLEKSRNITINDWEIAKCRNVNVAVIT